MRAYPRFLRPYLRRFAMYAERHGTPAAFGRSLGVPFRALRRYGLRGLANRVRDRYKAPPPVRFEPKTHPFDLRHGTDTSGFLQGSHADYGSLADLRMVAYYGISPSTLAEALIRLPIQPAEFTFVDIGCGKGRPLLVAAQFDFQQIIGIELNPEFVRIAQANLHLEPRAAGRISVLVQEATSFVFPQTPLVLFLYYPFHDSVLRSFLRNLERQLRRSPRETWLLYASYPKLDEGFTPFPWLRLMWDEKIAMSEEDTAGDVLNHTTERYMLFKSEIEPQ